MKKIGVKSSTAREAASLVLFVLLLAKLGGTSLDSSTTSSTSISFEKQRTEDTHALLRQTESSLLPSVMRLGTAMLLKSSTSISSSSSTITALSSAAPIFEAYNRTIDAEQVHGAAEQAAAARFYARLGKRINLIISPVLLALGGVGNPLCIVILLNKKRTSPTIVYLCVLAAFDFLVLYTGLLRQYLKDAFGVDVRNYSSFNCRFHTFATYTFTQVSSYILVAVTLNRFTIIFNRTICCKPKKISRSAGQRESARSIVWIVAGICVLVSALNLHFLIYYDLVAADEKETRNQFLNNCTPNKRLNPTYYRFRTDVYAKMHLYLYIVIPCCILFVMNLLIIRKIMQSSKSRLGERQSKERKRKEKKKTALSIMLVSVCLWFMILKTPASVYLNFPVKEMSQSYFPFTYSLFMLINYTNHAVNLILYITISSSFRDEIKVFVRRILSRIATPSSPCRRSQTDKFTQNAETYNRTVSEEDVKV